MKYNRLTFVEEAGRNKFQKKLWKCICDCGNEVIAIGSAIKNGYTKSCGCWMREQSRHSIARARSFKQDEQHYHAIGGKTSPTYQSWRAMKQRCYCPDNKDYHCYGGRGIEVYKPWKDSFIQFLKDMGERPSKDYSLDRIDPDQDYCPSNCQWITKSENSRRGNAQRARRRGAELPLVSLDSGQL